MVEKGGGELRYLPMVQAGNAALAVVTEACESGLEVLPSGAVTAGLCVAPKARRGLVTAPRQATTKMHTKHRMMWSRLVSLRFWRSRTQSCEKNLNSGIA